jgi:hypothetical protein
VRPSCALRASWPCVLPWVERRCWACSRFPLDEICALARYGSYSCTQCNDSFATGTGQDAALWSRTPSALQPGTRQQMPLRLLAYG